jgi:hypothetical protein
MTLLNYNYLRDIEHEKSYHMKENKSKTSIESCKVASERKLIKNSKIFLFYF